MLFLISLSSQLLWSFDQKSELYLLHSIYFTWEALHSVFDVLSDKISKPNVQNHDFDDCSDLYPDQSKSSPTSLPISPRLRRSFRMSDAHLSDLHSLTTLVGASETELRNLGIFQNKH